MKNKPVFTRAQRDQLVRSIDMLVPVRNPGNARLWNDVLTIIDSVTEEPIPDHVRKVASDYVARGGSSDDETLGVFYQAMCELYGKDIWCRALENTRTAAGDAS